MALIRPLTSPSVNSALLLCNPGKVTLGRQNEQDLNFNNTMVLLFHLTERWL